MIVLALVVAGAASYFRLGVDRFPSVDLPTLSIRTTLPGASPEEVEAEIAQRIEEAVNSVEGIEELRSISGQGSSVIIVTFDLDTQHRRGGAGCPRPRRHRPARSSRRDRSTDRAEVR